MSNINDYIYRERGEICEFCNQPTSIASRNKHKRGIVCDCDWKVKRAVQFVEKIMTENDDLKRKIKEIYSQSNDGFLNSKWIGWQGMLEIIDK